MTDPHDPLLIWGAGAMGGTIGGVLARAGHAVRFVDRDGAHVAALNRDGLRVTGPQAEFTVPADAVTPSALTGRYGRMLLCVKAHHTEEAIREAALFLTDDGWVASIQNGLNEPVIAAEVGAARTIGAFVNFGADVLEPGVVHWGGRGAVVVGELDGRSTERVRALHDLLRIFEPNAVLTDTIFGYLWSKLAYGALLFVTALTDDPIADALADREHRPVYVAIAREVCRVAHAEGIPLQAFDGFDPAAFAPDASLATAHASLDALVSFNRRSAKTHSGIWRDLAVRRRRTEVDAQLGPVAGAGRRLGVPTPVVDAVITQIHEIEAGARRQERANVDVLVAVVGGTPDREERP
ncbi:MAG: 2-dehydropantoate 2-reductase [Gemmatimonadota bacterium]